MSKLRNGDEFKIMGVPKEADLLTIDYRSDSNRNTTSRSKHRVGSQYGNIHWWPSHIDYRYWHRPPDGTTNLYLQHYGRCGAKYVLCCHNVLTVVHFDSECRTGPSGSSNFKTSGARVLPATCVPNLFPYPSLLSPLQQQQKTLSITAVRLWRLAAAWSKPDVGWRFRLVVFKSTSVAIQRILVMTVAA